MTEEEIAAIEAWADQYKGLPRPPGDGAGRPKGMQIRSHVYGQLLESAQEVIPELVAEVRRLKKLTGEG